MNCPACAASVQPGSRFCWSCGNTLISQPDERRVATVLFGDLVGFTTFSEAADPEQVKELVDGCFDALCNDVTAFGGRVDKIMGDAIVALFGAPVAHEDDAERAVRAALRMQETLARLRHERGVDAQLRVGVNTGEVVVGALRAGGDYTALGDAVNTANRLQTAAEPGEILVGERTRAATDHAIDYEDRGALSVKGREESVAAWRAIEAVAPPGQRRRHTRTPLIGREPELALLRSIVDSAVARSRAHFVLLVGEAGVGKSRLTGDVATYTRQAHDARVLGGQCIPYGADTWWPIAEAIRGACGIAASDSATDARAKLTDAVSTIADVPDTDEIPRVVNGLLYLLGHVGELADVDPGRARDDSARSVRLLFQGIAKTQPLVLVLAEMQWADELVLHLVQRLLVRLRNLPFVVLGTALPDAQPQTRVDPARGNLTVIGLDPLDEASVRALAHALLGDDIDDRLAAALHERSGGNPFFVEELTALLRESPAAAEDPLKFLDTGGVPVTLQGLVATRLDALAPDARGLLEDCAIVGSSGQSEAAYALGAARGIATGAAMLRDLAERELIDAPDGDAEFTFTSEVIREVAYATITKGERARRHAALAAWLAERSDPDDANAHERIAYHYATSAVTVRELGSVADVPVDLEARAVAAVEGAAFQARSAEMWRAAFRLYDQALAVAGPATPEPVRWRLLLGRARAAAEQRDLASARRDAEAVLEAADDEPTARADVLTLLGDIQTMEGDYSGARVSLETAIEVWRALGDVHGEAEAVRARGRCSMFGGNMPAAEADFGDALALYRRAGDRRGEAWSLQNLATIAFFLGNTEKAEERLARAEVTFRQLGDYGGLNWTFAVLAWVRFMKGRRDDAERLALEQLPESEATGNRWVTAILQMLLGSIALWSGRSNVAVERSTAAVAAMEELKDPWGTGQASAVWLRALAAAGRIHDAIDAVDVLIDGARAAGQPIEAFVYTIQVQILIAAGTADALPVALHLAPSAEDARTMPFNVERRVALARALLQAGRIDESIAEFHEIATHVPDLRAGPGAAVRSALGLAFVAAGRLDEAAALVADGVEGSYLDDFQLALVDAFVALRRGTPDALARFDEVVTRIDETEAALEQAIARVARAHAYARAGHSQAAEARAEADHACETIGAPMPGWEMTFRLAAGA